MTAAFKKTWTNNHTDHFTLGVLRVHIWNSDAVKFSFLCTSVGLDKQDQTSVLFKLVSVVQSSWVVFIAYSVLKNCSLVRVRKDIFPTL